MELFRMDSAANLLPYDGVVNYHGPVLSLPEAQRYEERLLATIPWRNDKAVIFGRHMVTARKVAWYGDSDFSYTYSGVTRQALAWTEELKALKQLAESLSGSRFNSCLLNLYHHGGEGMAWHSDDERELSRDSAIASLSLGAGRKFSFKHKRSGETVSLVLENGSLLVMRETTQTHWLHRLPKSTRIQAPRINLTFRTMAAA